MDRVERGTNRLREANRVAIESEQIGARSRHRIQFERFQPRFIRNDSTRNSK